MREQSAAQVKGRGAHRQDVPREGTRIRRMYDLLMANKGQGVEVNLTSFENKPSRSGVAINYLRDFYGLDIRRLRNGHWVLAGEWFGKVYVDYIAQRHES